MIQKYTKIIFLILSVFCCNEYLSAKDKYLPEEITDSKTFTLKIFYDNANRICGIRTQNTFPDGQTQLVNTIYEYYPNGFLKTINSETKIRPDSVAMNIRTTDKYDYQVVSDTVISITLTKNYQLNGESYVKDTLSSSKIYLNKEMLPYKMVSIDGYNSIITTTDTIEYTKSNEVVKTEQSIINKWGDQYIYISNEVVEWAQQKNIFSDVTKSRFMQIPLEKQWFYFFADEAPALVKSLSKIQDDNDQNIQNIQFSYKSDNKGYPVKIHSTKTREGIDPQQSTLIIKYKKVRNKKK